MEVTIIRESTKETRAAILKSAMEVFLEVGYQEASMRKIAARAGITAGAIYKHFSGKEEMFDEIFEESGRKLMEVTESMIGIDFTAMSDDELLCCIPGYQYRYSICLRATYSSFICC